MIKAPDVPHQLEPVYRIEYAHMALLDSMPKEWRMLAYEYGLKVTNGLYVTGSSFKQAEIDLQGARENAQMEHFKFLSTVKVLKKSDFFRGVGGFKTETEHGLAKPKVRFKI